MIEYYHYWLDENSGKLTGNVKFVLCQLLCIITMTQIYLLCHQCLYIFVFLQISEIAYYVNTNILYLLHII